MAPAPVVEDEGGGDDGQTDDQEDPAVEAAARRGAFAAQDDHRRARTGSVIDVEHSEKHQHPAKTSDQTPPFARIGGVAGQLVQEMFSYMHG